MKVTNIGGASSSPGSLRLKAAKGVNVKRAKQQLPILAPGGSWTVFYEVELTAKAKKIFDALAGRRGGHSQAREARWS